MAFNVPSLSDVSRTIENGFSSAFYGKSGTLRVGVLKVLSKVIAGGCYLPILFCQYIWRNSFIDTCDVDNLVRFGGWYNLPHKVASPARGEVSVSFKRAYTLQAGYIFTSPKTGEQYKTIENVSGNANETKLVNVVSLNVGTGANISVWDIVTLEPETEIEISVMSRQINGGSLYEVQVNGVVEQWGEDVESYRKRLKFRRQNQPRGGSDADYKMWAEKFSQVTDAFVFGNFPRTNSVSIYCADYNDGDVSLTESALSEVRDYITDDVRRPVTSEIIVKSVSPVSVGLTIALPSVGGSVRDSVVSLLKEKFKGFGFGSVINADVVKKIILESGIAENCEIRKLTIAGETYTSKNYTFKKNASVCEVVNTNRIDELLSLVVL